MVHEDVVQMHLSCSNLPHACSTGVRVIASASVDDRYGFVEIAQTETITNQVNATFEKVIPIVVRLDLNQDLKFALYHVDGASEALIEKMGEVEVGLFSLVSSAATILLPFGDSPSGSWAPDDAPVLSVSTEMTENSWRGTSLQFIGSNLAVHGHHTAPYFTLCLAPNASERPPILLYRSEIAFDQSDPKWKEFSVPTRYFPTTAEWTLEVCCYNFNHNAEDTVLGRFTTTFYQLLSGHASNKYLLRGGGKKKDHMTMELLKVGTVEKVPHLIGLLRSGMQLHFTIAIDFTANNGGQNDMNALHYVHPHQSSIYTDVLASITPTITKFDSLKRVSVLGFGAKVPPSFQLSQLFALNGNLDNPHIRGTEDVLQCYRRSAISVLPYAPTEYSSVIHYVMKHAKASARSSTIGSFYFVCIILTNGSLKSPTDTVDTIVQASGCPMSIVFVALGNDKHPVCGGDRTKLQRLLSPSLKNSNNVPLRREVVTYVEHTESVEEPKVTQKVLENIPRQVALWALQENSTS